MAEKKTKEEQEISPELRKKLEAEAFARVCKAAGTTPEDIANMEKAKVKAKEEVDYNTNNILCSINGVTYPSKGRATREIAEQLIALASAKRQRLINEKVGRDAQIIQTINGEVGFKEIRRVDEAGIEVSVQ